MKAFRKYKSGTMEHPKKLPMETLQHYNRHKTIDVIDKKKKKPLRANRAARHKGPNMEFL